MRWLTSFAMLFLLSPSIFAEDWPQWLGPNRDGSTPEKVSPWGKKGLPISWKQKVGEGHSSPVVADGKVYLFAKDRDKNAERLSVFDAKKGTPLWSKSYKRGDFKSLFGNGPRSTPAVVNGRAFTFGITGILTCFDVEKKDIAWQIDTLDKFNVKNLFFGASCSPLIEGGKVLMNIGGKGASVVAFDTKTGKVIWKSLDHGATYSSGIVFGKGIERQAAFLTKEALVGIWVKEGSVFWQYPLKDRLAESSTTPVRIGDVLVGSSITTGCVGLKLITSTAIPRVKKLWKNPKLTCYFSTPVAVGDTLYMVTGTPPPAIFITADLHCVNPKTGKIIWTKKRVGKYHASLIRTGDDKLLMLEEAGDLVLLDPSRKGYRELARTKICGNTWAHPAIANGRLYVRDGKQLICVSLR